MEAKFGSPWFLLFEIFEMFKLFWPVFVLIAAVSSLVYVWACVELKTEKPSFLLITSFSMLGATVGILTGWSRSPVVGTAITSIIGLLGGLSIYLIGKKEYPRAVVSSCVFIISLFLIVGTYMGGKIRSVEIESDRKYDEWLLNYKRNLQDKNAEYASKLEVWKKDGMEGIKKRNKAITK